MKYLQMKKFLEQLKLYVNDSHLDKEGEESDDAGFVDNNPPN